MKSLFIALSLLSVQAFGAFTVPALPNPVNDYSNVLTVAGKEEIARAIVELKKQTGAQAGVLIVDTLDGDSVEEASMKVARAWKLGSAKNDDGILLLVAVKDRKLRIEVGQGLEGVVTDAHSKRILGTMKPYLKAGNYDQGVLTGIGLIALKITAGKDEIQKGTVTATTDDSTGFFIFLAIIAGLGVIATIFHLKRTKEEAEQNPHSRFCVPTTPQDYRSTRDEAEDSGIANAAILAATIASSRSETRNDEAETSRRKRNDEEEETRRRRRNDDDDSSRRSSYSDDSSSSSSSSSSSDWGGGGGDFSGGGSSDSF